MNFEEVMNEAMDRKIVICLLFWICSSFFFGEEVFAQPDLDRVAAMQTMTRSVKGVHRNLWRTFPMSRVWDLFDSNKFLSSQDWWQKRKDWEEKGVEFSIVYTGAWISNTSGGLKRGTSYIGNLDLTMTLDTAKLGLWPNGTFFIYGLHTHRTASPSATYIGDLQAVSNIDGPRLFRLYEFWYEHKFADEIYSLLLGLHDLNSEFVTTEYGGLFINSSFGIIPTMSLNTTVSTFPITAPAVRFKWTPNESFEWLFGVYNGDPGDENYNPHGVRWAFNKKHGLLSISELSMKGDLDFIQQGQSLPGAVKIGAWHSNNDLDDVLDVDANSVRIRHDDNYGIYGIFDQDIYREDENQGLGFFLQLGAAPKDRNQVSGYIGAGFNYTGLIPGRNEDVVGLAIASAQISKDYRVANSLEKKEETLELSYRAQVTPSIVLQPDVQYIKNPGADPNIKDAVATTIQFEVSF